MTQANVEQNLHSCKKEVIELIFNKVREPYVDYRALRELRILLEALNSVQL